MELELEPKVREIARLLATSPRLDDERKIAALENYAKGIYTNAEALVISQFHITSTPLKLFFLSKHHSLDLTDTLCTKNHAAFVCTPSNPENLTEQQRFHRATQFAKAESATIVRAIFYLRERSDYLQIMWLDPMLMKISLGQECPEINRTLYQTDDLERGTWIRKLKSVVVLTDQTDPEKIQTP